MDYRARLIGASLAGATGRAARHDGRLHVPAVVPSSEGASPWPASPPERNAGKKAILIVDDHPLMRRGLTALIDSEPDLVVCAEVGNRHSRA